MKPKYAVIQVGNTGKLGQGFVKDVNMNDGELIITTTIDHREAETFNEHHIAYTFTMFLYANSLGRFEVIKIDEGGQNNEINK